LFITTKRHASWIWLDWSHSARQRSGRW